MVRRSRRRRRKKQDIWVCKTDRTLYFVHVQREERHHNDL